MLNNIGLAARKRTEPKVKPPFECSSLLNSQDWNYTWGNLFSTLCWNLTDTQACLLNLSKCHIMIPFSPFYLPGILALNDINFRRLAIPLQWSQPGSHQFLRAAFEMSGAVDPSCYRYRANLLLRLLIKIWFVLFTLSHVNGNSK